VGVAEWGGGRGEVGELLNMEFILIFSTNLSENFLILRIIKFDMIRNVHSSLCKVPVILLRF